MKGLVGIEIIGLLNVLDVRQRTHLIMHAIHAAKAGRSDSAAVVAFFG